VISQAAARNHAMQMRVKLEILTPGVENSKESDLGSEMFRIGSNGFQRFGGGTKKDAKHQVLILVGNGCDLVRHRKDDMEIADFQKFGLTVFNPFRPGERLAFGAVPVAATVEAITFIVTLIAALHVAAKCRCPARLYCRYDAPLFLRHRRIMMFSIILTVAAEHVRHLPLRAIHRART